MRRLYWLPAGALLAAESLVAVVAHLWLSWPFAWLLTAGLYLFTLARFISALRDRARPLWITRLVDTPLFWLWGAAMCALVALPLELVLSLALAAAGGSFARAFELAVAGAYALGLVVSGYSIWIERRRVQVRRIDVPVEDLPAELDGYRIAQLSDLHVGSFDRLDTARRWVRLANAERPDLCAVTGDLVTTGRDFHGDVATALADLSAPDGVFVILGNHDRTESEQLTQLLRARNLTVLHDESRVVRRGSAALTVAGLDGRNWRSELGRALKEQTPGAPVVLLAHYPTVFKAAAAAGVALVLSGHTHGGQLGVPFLSDRYNLATLTRQLPRGIYRKGDSTLYVSAGLGTTGPPMRLAVPPEIALLTLRRSERTV